MKIGLLFPKTLWNQLFLVSSGKWGTKLHFACFVKFNKLEIVNCSIRRFNYNELSVIKRTENGMNDMSEIAIH